MENTKELKLYCESETFTFRLVSDPELADVLIDKEGALSIKTRQTEKNDKKQLQQCENLEANTVQNAAILEMDISNLLIKLGIPASIKGYRFAREAIKIIIEEPEAIHAITKCIYPEVAERFDTTASRVERAIRHAVEISVTRANYELYNELFGNTVASSKAKPTNSEFLAIISEHFRLLRK